MFKPRLGGEGKDTNILRAASTCVCMRAPPDTVGQSPVFCCVCVVFDVGLVGMCVRFALVPGRKRLLGGKLPYSSIFFYPYNVGALSIVIFVRCWNDTNIL